MDREGRLSASDNAPLSLTATSSDQPAYNPVLQVLLLFGLLASCAIVFLTKIWSGVPPQDEGILLTYPDLINRGFRPYRDFTPLYTPGTFYVIAGAFKLLGASLGVERAVGGLYWLSLVAAMYCIGKQVSAPVGLLAGAACLLGLRFFNFGAYAVIAAQAFALAALALTATSANSGIRHLSSLSGILAVVSLWFRQDIGAVTCATLLVLHANMLRDRLPAYLLGVALAGLPLFLLFLALRFDAGF